MAKDAEAALREYGYDQLVRVDVGDGSPVEIGSSQVEAYIDAHRLVVVDDGGETEKMLATQAETFVEGNPDANIKEEIEVSTEALPVFAPSRPSRERWEKVDGGWLCFGFATSGIVGGEPWGLPAGPGRMQVPYRQLESYATVGGLHPVHNPEAFEWVWPEERVLEIFEYAPKNGEGNQFRRTSSGKLVPVRERS